MWQLFLVAALAFEENETASPSMAPTPEPTALPTGLYWGLVFGCTFGGALIMTILGAIGVVVMNKQRTAEYEDIAAVVD